MSHAMNRLLLFPDTTKIEQDALTIAGQDLAFLADKYGTPLYLYDQATMDNAVAGYKDALASSYPGPASVTYAGKAWLNTALAQWTQRHGLWLDCTGEGEIAIARAGGVAREQILVHGVNKSQADLKSALQNAGTIVVDNLTELERVSRQVHTYTSKQPSLWLRLLPGLAVTTHHTHTQTGQHDSKFGMTGEELVEAAEFCKKNHLPLNGIHFHQGSNFRDPEPLIPAIEMALELAKGIGFKGEWHFCPGGGWGVAYHEDELPQPDVSAYVHLIAESVEAGCKKHGVDLPHLHIEPGRSIAARAGVALYRVETVKRQGGRTWLLVDGGLADNPRHALYGARYSCLTVSGPSRERSERVSIAGPYCESGDVLIEDLPMPKVEAGELIAVPMSGAYQLSMSSNYNGARRPAVAWLGENGAQLIQRRETVEDLLRRDVNLPG
ncbi:MAG: diaminopimelate decarboxylase [Chloroflexota bacterium]